MALLITDLRNTWNAEYQAAANDVEAATGAPLGSLNYAKRVGHVALAVTVTVLLAEAGGVGAVVELAGSTAGALEESGSTTEMREISDSGTAEDRPDLGTPGTLRNPDGTRSHPIDQEQGLKEYQQRGGLAEGTKKSEQVVDNWLKSFEGQSSEEIDEEDFD